MVCVATSLNPGFFQMTDKMIVIICYSINYGLAVLYERGFLRPLENVVLTLFGLINLLMALSLLNVLRHQICGKTYGFFTNILPISPLIYFILADILSSKQHLAIFIKSIQLLVLTSYIGYRFYVGNREQIQYHWKWNPKVNWLKRAIGKALGLPCLEHNILIPDFKEKEYEETVPFRAPCKYMEDMSESVGSRVPDRRVPFLRSKFDTRPWNPVQYMSVNRVMPEDYDSYMQREEEEWIRRQCNQLPMRIESPDADCAMDTS